MYRVPSNISRGFESGELVPWIRKILGCRVDRIGGDGRPLVADLVGGGESRIRRWWGWSGAGKPMGAVRVSGGWAQVSGGGWPRIPGGSSR
jgi:hypothetical protein